MDYLVVRAAPSDRVTDRYGEQANVVVTSVGRLPGNLQASRAQVRDSSACEAGGWVAGAMLACAAVQKGCWRTWLSVLLATAAIRSPGSSSCPAPSWATRRCPAHFTLVSRQPFPGVQVAAVVAEAMAQAKGDAIIEVAASPAAPDAPLRSQVAAALAGAQLEVEEEEEEEEEEPAPAPAKRGGFFTIGGSRKPAPKAVVVEEEEEEEEGEWGG